MPEAKISKGVENKNFILATASLIGTIIGAGVFGIPYVTAKAGVLPCLFYFLVLGASLLLLHLFFGEIVLRTRGKHRLVGYVEKYLGKRAKAPVAFSTIVGTIGALLAYVILAGKFLKIISPSFLSSFQWSLILWAILSFFVLLGIKSIAPVELLMNIGFFVAISLIFIFCLSKIELSNFTLISSQHIFLPFGVLLFSLVGWSAVPEIEAILKEKKNLKKVIVSAMMICICFYILFGLLLSGVTGKSTTQEALEGLLPILGQKIMVLGGIFGVLAISTSFLILGNYVKNTLIFDYRFPPLLAFFIACFSPLFLFLVGIRGFIPVIGVVGTFVGLVEGTSIALIYKKAKKQGDKTPGYSLKIPNILIYFLIAILVLGTAAQIIFHG